MNGEKLIAEVREAELDLEIPRPPDWESTTAARPESPSLLQRMHPLSPDGVGFHPVCFCCGADHEDGLKVYAAPVNRFQRRTWLVEGITFLII